MARGKKTGGKDFEAGHHIGRPPMSPETKALQRLTQAQVSTLITDYMQKSLDELDAILKDPIVASLNKIVAKIISKAIGEGDQSRLTFLLERGLGRAPQEVPIPKTFDPIKSLENSLRISNTALTRLEHKQRMGNPLSLDEYKAMRELTKTVHEINEHIESAKSKLNLSSLSDEELREKARPFIENKEHDSKKAVN